MMHFEIDSNKSGMRIDKYLQDELNKRLNKSYSRSFISANLSEFISVNSKKVKAAYKAKFGDNIEIDLGKLEELHEKFVEENSIEERIVSQEGVLEILDETGDYLVINKQAGIPVHPGHGNASNTIANYVKGYLEGKGEFDPELDRSGIVHRLDKNVSGLMIIAKNRKTQLYLKSQFENHTVLKMYLAKVVKLRDSGFTKYVEQLRKSKSNIKSVVELREFKIDSGWNVIGEWFRAEGYISRSPKDRTLMEFTSVKLTGRKSRWALSHIYPMSRDVLALKIETGRMHQIRATLKYLGYGIVGDLKYGGPLAGENEEKIELYSACLGIRFSSTVEKVWFL